MTFPEFDYKEYLPTEDEVYIRNYVENQRSRKSTPFRLRACAMAEWAEREYKAQRSTRINDRDILQIPFSYNIVNQRLSQLNANPSKAEYRVVDADKEHDVEILKQVDRFDQQVSNYNSTYQDIQMTANIEGTCWVGTSWEEMLDENGAVVGNPSTKIRRIRMNDFFPDIAARTPREMNDGIERRVMSYEQFLRIYLPLDGKHGFKNIRCIVPVHSDTRQFGSVWEEDWEQLGRDVWGDNVVIWIYESKAMLHKDGVRPKSVMIANGVVIYESDKLWTPKRSPNDPEVLMWTAIYGIPTGTLVGMGIPALIRHPQAAFDRLLTMSVAQAELALAPPLFLRPGADQDMDDYPVFPGRTVPIRGSGKSITEDYQFLQIPDITSGSQVMMSDLVRYMTMLSGVDIQALFVAPSEKAVTTENKRQIQEKLLRFSVLWNEENGFWDMKYLRLRLMQCYYPKRILTYQEDAKGNYEMVEKYRSIPIVDYEVDEGVPGENRIKLNFKKGGYTKIDITPENLKFDVDLVIEGASTGQERDVIAQQNFIKNLQFLFSIPQFAEKLSSDKMLKMLLEKVNIPENDVLDQPMTQTNPMHPALKEIEAIKLMDILEPEGIKYPDSLDQFLPEDYNPEEFVRIYTTYMMGHEEEIKSDWSEDSKKMLTQRYDYHQTNANNPLFFEIQAKRELSENAQKMGAQAEMLDKTKGDKVPPAPPGAEEGESSLISQVRREGGQLAAAVRGQ